MATAELVEGTSPSTRPLTTCTRPLRARSGPAGALLAVGLAATAAHVGAGLGGCGALAGRRELRHDDLVDQGDVDLHVEDLAGQGDRAVGRAVGGDHVDLAGSRFGGHVSCVGARSVGAHSAAPFAAVRTRTMPPLGPGMAPLMSSSPRSVSTAWTVRFWVVVRAWPIRPAILMPLNTRPGVDAPPMEPGLRWLRCEPWDALTPWKPWRFITPAVPLPLLVATTSTICPDSNSSAVISWPSV